MKKISINKLLSNASFIALFQSVIISGFYFNILRNFDKNATIIKESRYFFIYFLILFIYLMKRELVPVLKFLECKDESKFDSAVYAYNNIFKKSIIISTSLIFINGLYNVYFFKSNIFLEFINLVFLSYYFNFLFYILMECLGYSKIAQMIYSDHNIYSEKKGFSLGINTKFYFIIINLFIIPYCIILSHLMKSNYVLVYLPFYIIIIALALFLIKRLSISYKLSILVLICFLLIISNTQSVESTFLSLYSIILISVLFSALSFDSIYKSINSPLIELKNKMIRLSNGDFDVKTRVYSDDEIGTIKVNFNNMIDGLREREYVKETLGKVVSYEVAKKMIRDKGVSLGGDLVNGTVLFSDIRGFTEMSEKMDAQHIVSLLNKYFTNITNPILKNKGIVNKFIGDAILAVFLKEFGAENTSEDALRSAFDMIDALDDFNNKNEDYPDIRFGIGIHTGSLVAGNIGSDERMEYTVIGDTVNVASRIESETKKQNSTVLISKSVYNDLSDIFKKDLLFTQLDDVKVKGRKQSLTLYVVNKK